MSDTQQTGTLLDTLDQQPVTAPNPVKPAAPATTPASEAPAPAAKPTAIAPTPAPTNQTTGTLLDSIEPQPAPVGSTPVGSTSAEQAPVQHVGAQKPDLYRRIFEGADAEPDMDQEKHSTVAKLWNWANGGVISKETFVRAATGMTIDQFRDAMHMESSDEGAATELLQKVKDAEKKYGVNDPRTQQLRRYAQTADDAGRYWATFGRKMFSGSLEDTAQNASDYVSPMSFAMMALGPIAKSASAAAKVLPSTSKLAAALRGAKTTAEITSLAASLGFGVNGATEVFKNMPEAMKNDPEALRATFLGLSMMAAAGHHAGKEAQAKVAARKEAARIEAAKNPRMTTQKIAGVDTPVLTTEPEPEMTPQEAAANMSAKEFHQKVTKPAATKGVVNNLNQVMEDAIGKHEAIASGSGEPDKIAGTSTPSKFSTIDEAVDAAEAAAKKTWSKGDAIDEQEAQAHEAEKARIVKEAQAQHDEYNSRVVDGYNSTLADGEEPMPRVEFDESKVQMPEKPQSLAELRSELQQAKAKGASSDPKERQEAYDKDIPKAQKALDGWFKAHEDTIPKTEYDSLRRLNYQFERMQEISNALRAKLDNGNLTGNNLRSIEANMVNKAIRRGIPDAVNSFRNLLGDEGYANWRKLASVLDPVNNTPGETSGGSFKKFAGAVLSHFLPGGFVARHGAKFLIDRAIADPEWNKWTTNSVAEFKATGQVSPESVTGLGDLIQHTKMSPEEAKAGAKLSTELSSQLAKQATPVGATPEAGAKYGATNTGVSTEEYRKALDSFNRTIQGGMKTGVPLPLGDMLTIGRYHMEAGAHAFKEWSGQMISELGEAIRPQLQKVWDALSASDEAHAQFNAHKENGGSTFSPEGDNVGQANAFAVSAYPTRTKQFADGEFSPKHFDEFRKDNSDLLEQPGHAVGSWHDPDTGLHTLDVTRLIPDQAQAESVGRTANQKSIYHLGRGELVDTGGTGEAQVSHVVEDYNRRLGKPAVQDVKTPVNPELANQIADAYDQLKHEPNNPKVKKAYNALIKETKAQWKALQAAGYKLQPEDVDPYGLNSDTPAYDEMAQDVKNNKRIKVWTGGQPPADHPLSKIDPETGVSYNTLFRAVHDIMGHVAGGNDFSQQGEENAYQRHAQSYSKNAVPALTTETRGQTSHYFNNEKVRGGANPDFVDQRAALLPSKFYAKEGSRWSGVIDQMKERYGTTSDPLKAGFILPEGDMIPLAEEHDKMLGGRPSDDLRESFIKDTGAIRTRYRMSRAGEEQVFSLPKAITEEQARQIKAAAGKLRYGTVTMETVDGKNHATIEFPTMLKVQEAIDRMVRVKPLAETNPEMYKPIEDEPAPKKSFADVKPSKVSHTGKGFEEQKYPRSFEVNVEFPNGEPHTDEVKGLNEGHALSRAKGNWPDASNITVTRETTPPASKTESLANTVGSAERAKGDTDFFKQAKESMPDATMSQQLMEAERLRREALKPAPSKPELKYSTEDGDYTRDGQKEFTLRSDHPDGTDVGSLTVRPQADGEARVDDAFLRKEFRGQGLGKEIYQRAMDEAKSRGFDKFTSSHLNGISPEAAAVWKSLGAEVKDGRYQIDLSSPTDNSASELPTRYPKGKSFSTAPNADQHVDMDAMNRAAELAPSRTTPDGNKVIGYDEKMARTVKDYPGMNVSAAELKQPKKVIGKFIDHVAGNLEWLYNQVPPEIRDSAKNWYDSANKVITKAANRYGVTPEQASGVTAVLSPSNAWDNNVNLTHRMLKVWADHQNTKFSPDMQKRAIDLGQQYPKFKPLLKQLVGKSLGEISVPDPDVQAVLKGLWIRMFDEAHHDAQNDLYSPDGTVTPGAAGRVAWQGNGALAKAVRILENPSLENINANLGNGHKVRNFYNNIINPNSTKGHVTIDTHAVSAGLLTPMANDSLWASQNFGGSVKGVPRAPGSDPVGLKGSYPMYAEAYRRVAAKLGIQPRQLQSIVWEGAKSLMQDKKTPEMQSKIADIWNQVSKKRLTIDAARGMIKEVTGGFSKPAWMSDDVWESIDHSNGSDDTSFEFGGE